MTLGLAACPDREVLSVLVAGAGSPAGQAVVAALSAGGHLVCAADPDADAVQALVDGVGPGVVLGVAGSPRDPRHQDDAVDYALAAFERIDGLVTVGAPVPRGWIYRVQLAWMAGHGGSITLVLPDESAGTAPGFTRDLARRVGPRTHLNTILAPTQVADLPGLVLRLIQLGRPELNWAGLSGRTLKPLAGGGWGALD